jgi:hypothetical protein
MIANGRDPRFQPRPFVNRRLGRERETDPTLTLRPGEPSELFVQSDPVAVGEVTQCVPRRY